MTLVDTFDIEAYQNDLYTDGNGVEHPVDSFLLEAYPWHFEQMDPARRKRILYAKTDMELVRVHPTKKDFTTVRYTKCNARLEADTLIVDFNYNYHREPVVYFEQKLLTLKIWDSSYSASIIHASDVVGMHKVGDKFERVPFPETILSELSLTLNQQSFEPGDTIKGTFFGRNLGNEKEWLELSKGNFRAVVE